MKWRPLKGLNRELLWVLIVAVVLDTLFFAVVVLTMDVPPDSVLDSSLHEVLRVFEE